ncbi:uncharacterized protein [Clytia hemisphaerica]|uniref:uncharacterized protein isoform X1 n=1 Tax=Clytia hemisphaerica TaxID=252671 RepID=UPI0034D6AE31
MMEKLFKLIILVTIWRVHHGQILQVPSNITGMFKQSVTFDIIVDFGNNNTEAGGKIKSLIVEHRISTDIIFRIADGSDTGFTPKDASRFKGRITTAFNSTAGKFSLTLGNLNYDDDIKIHILLVYTELPSNHKVTEADIDLIVKGGPTLCGNEVPSAPKFDLAKPINIPLTLCGNPQPRLTYTFGSNPDIIEVTNITASDTNQHQYTYTMQLTDLKPSDCNSILSFLATGVGVDYKGESIIDLDFTPELTSVTPIRQNNQLITTWTPINTGGCPKVTYEIEYFLNDGNKTNITVTIPAGSSGYTHTVTDINDVIDIDSITLQATYRTFKSTVVRKNVTHIVTTAAPSTTTPTSTKTPKGGSVQGDQSNDEDVVLIAAVVGSVGFIIILIVVVLVFCVCSRKSKSSSFNINYYKDKAHNLQMNSIYEYDQKAAPIKSPKKPKNNPMYDIEPPTHHSFSNGGVTIEREDPASGSPTNGDVVDTNSHTQTHTPSKASSVRVADAQLKFYDPNEFGMTENSDENENTDRLSPPVSPAPQPGDNYSYDNTGETTGRAPELV